MQPSVEHGRLAVRARKCGDCHQSPDLRDGVLSGQTTPIVDYPQAYGSNLTPDPDTGMDAWDAGTIANALRRASTIRGNRLRADAAVRRHER